MVKLTTEAAAQQHVRREFGDKVGPIWRNNVGGAFDETGRLIRFGLGHENKMADDDPRSSDLIGITPVLIQPHMVGYYLGVFTAIEMKKPGWHMTPSDKRAIGQAKFHDMVRLACGFAGFATGPEDIGRIIGRG